MARTKTNDLALAVAVEDSLGVLPGSPEWALLQPNAIALLGTSITKVSRTPISKDRQRNKGAVTDLDSGVEFDADLTIEHFKNFAEGFFFSSFQGGDASRPSSTSTSAYTIPAIGTAYPANTLVHARGFTNSENNGLKVVDTGATTTSVPVTTSLVAETPPATQNVSLDECGFRFASGDAEIDANGDLITTTKDLTELPIVAGQSIWIGGADSANQFATGADKGFCRVTLVEANKLTLDKKTQSFSADTGTGKEIDIYFGRYLTNVTVDDANYLERSYQFEAAYTDLGGVGTDEYGYSKGNYANTLALELPLTDKASMSFGFTGTTTTAPSTSRATGADAPIEPVSALAFNTSADIARLRIQDVDEFGLATDFKSLTFNVNNNVGPEKVLAQLGAKYMNTGLFEIGVEVTVLFTRSDIISIIRNNTTVTMDFVLRNDDGILLFDVPSMTLSDGSPEFTINESITLNLSAQSFADDTFNNSISVSLFPYAPNF